MKAIQFATIVVLSLLMLADAAPQVLADGGLVNVDGVHYVRGKRQAPGGACVINCDDASGDIVSFEEQIFSYSRLAVNLM